MSGSICHGTAALLAAMAFVLPALARSGLIPGPGAGPAPSLALSPDRGAPGDTLTVSGVATGEAAGSAVRVQWLAGSATEPVVESAIDGSGAFVATVRVPADAAPGEVRVCAGLTDLPAVELACVPFIVDPPAPGIVDGKLPAGVDRRTPAAISDKSLASAKLRSRAGGAVNQFAATTVSLVDRRGRIVATVVPHAKGTYRFTGVAPGAYTVVQGGAGGKAVAPAPVDVTPGATSVVTSRPVAAQFGCIAVGDQIPININNMRAQPTAPAANAHFGTYFSGVPLPVEFSLGNADVFMRVTEFSLPPPVPGDRLDGIEYVFADPQGRVVDRVRGSGFTDVVVFDVGRLPPGISTVTPYPVVNGQVCVPFGFETFRRTIRVVPNPIGSFARADSTISWVGGIRNDGYYRIRAVLPRIPGLPLSFPDPPLTQVPGTSFDLPIVVRNEFDARTILRANVKLDGQTTFRSFAAGLGAVVLDRDVLDEEAPLPLPGNLRLNFLDPRRSSFEVNAPSLLPIRQEFTIYEGTVLDLFGLVQVIGALTAGFQGDVGLFTTMQPFVPNITARVVPEVSALGSVSAGLGALNFVSGGARLNTRIGIAVPFSASIDPLAVGADNPCGLLQASVELFVRLSAGPVTLLRISSPSYPIVLPAGVPLYFPPPFCDAGNVSVRVAGEPRVPVAAAMVQALDDTLDGEPSPLPAVNPAPSLAVSDDGQRLRVYVEDATAGTDTITPRIVAQFQDAATGAWGAITPITDGSHWVADPVVTWAGSGAAKIAVAAWTERPTTLAEDLAIGDDIGALLARHEISVATFLNGVWSAPVRLTNDLLPDGSASIAGDATGYTLAWVFDQDGNAATRHDVRLKIREATLDGGVTTTVLPSHSALNAEPSVVRRDGATILAFTRDYDPANPLSAYRTVEVAYGNAGVFDGSTTVATGESPSLAITSDGREWIGFLDRQQNDDLQPIGNFGTRARVQSATRFGNRWYVSSTGPDESGGASEVRGESPVVVTRGTQAFMVFRSFATNTPGFGQLMLARLDGPEAVNPFTQLTFGDKHRWFPTAAIDPTNGELVSVALDVPGATPAPDDYALVTTQMSGLADPALVSLAFDPPWAAPGTPVEVEATVRNLGLAPTAADLVVEFLDGPPGSGSILASEPVGSAVGFLDSGAAFATIVAREGAQAIWARVRTAGHNANPANDVLSGSLRTLAPPRHVQVQPAPDGSGSLDVTWLGSLPSGEDATEPGEPEPAPQVGYRIERSDTSGGVRELAGEATGTAFRDALLQSGTPYCYVVIAYDATGLVSPPSAEACIGAAPARAPRGVPLLGTSLYLAGRGDNPAGHSLRIRSKDPAAGLGLVPESERDPVLHGATLRVGSSAGASFDGVYDLPARHWRYVTRRGVVRGYKYVVPRGDDGTGPVTSVVITRGKNLRISARGEAIVLALDGEPNPVNVELTIGPQSSCMQFGGAVKFTSGRSFSSRNAPAPATCPILPGS